MLTETSIGNLQYSRRLQECCFLLKHKYQLFTKTPLSEFWRQKETEFFKFEAVPQLRSILEYDLLRICIACQIEANIDHYLFVFTCAHYGVWRTTKWLKAEQSRGNLQANLELKVAHSTIRYLYALIINEKSIRIDPNAMTFIEEVSEKFKNKNEVFYLDKPIEKAEQKKFQFEISEIFPLDIANILDTIKMKTVPLKKIRGRDLKRHYLFWKWRQNGLSLKQIASKWNDEYEEGNPIINEDIVSKRIKGFEKTYGPLSKNTLYYFYNMLQYFNKTEAAERTFEFIMKNINVEM